MSATSSEQYLGLIESIGGKRVGRQLTEGAVDIGIMSVALNMGLGPSQQQIQDLRAMRGAWYLIDSVADHSGLAKVGLVITGLLKQGGDEGKQVCGLLIHLSVFSIAIARCMESLHLVDASRADLSYTWESRGKKVGAAYRRGADLLRGDHKIRAEERSQQWWSKPLDFASSIFKKSAYALACTAHRDMCFLDIRDAVNFRPVLRTDEVSSAELAWLPNFANAYRIWQKFQVSGDAKVKSCDQKDWIDRCIAALGECVNMTKEQVGILTKEAAAGLAKMGEGTKSSSSALKIWN